MTNVRVTDATGGEQMENFVVHYSSVRVIRLGVNADISTSRMDNTLPLDKGYVSENLWKLSVSHAFIRSLSIIKRHYFAIRNT